MRHFKIAFQVTIVIVLCLVLESASYFILRFQNISSKYLISFDADNQVKKMNSYGFDEIDPLCGWSMSNKYLNSIGYEVEQNCVVLRSYGDFPPKPIKIFITGGSTSDIALHKENWPNKLHEFFLKKKISAVIYVGAIGGYSSGQELLKLIRDGIALQPDIHISYSGANDGDVGGYVTSYERDLYENMFQRGDYSFLLPSTVFLIKRILYSGNSYLAIKKTEPIQAFDFWKQNMELMKGIDEQNKCQFIGILQPVLGVGKYHYHEQEDEFSYRVPMYKDYFPKASKFIKEKDSSLYDLTNLFDTAKGKVFIDDCHISESYQWVVANHIFTLLPLKLPDTTNK